MSVLEKNYIENAVREYIETHRERWNRLSKRFNPSGSNQSYVQGIELFGEVESDVEEILKKHGYKPNSNMRANIRFRMRKILTEEA